MYTLLFLSGLCFLMVAITASGWALLEWLWERQSIRDRRTRALVADLAPKGSWTSLSSSHASSYAPTATVGSKAPSEPQETSQRRS